MKRLGRFVSILAGRVFDNLCDFACEFGEVCALIGQDVIEGFLAPVADAWLLSKSDE